MLYCCLPISTPFFFHDYIMNHESLNRLNTISMNDAIDVVVIVEEAKEGEHKKTTVRGK